MPDINKAVEWAVEIANNSEHGYDQKKRNGPDYDCSSFISTALHEAGFNINPKSYTGNMLTQLKACGFIEIGVTEKRKKGDIFLTPNKHVVMCTGSSSIVHASINEKGTTTGGETGDQTGKEICTRRFYTPSYGWKYHFRYVESVNNDNAIEQAAKDVIVGKYGNGTERIEALKKAGLNPQKVQSMVNKMLKG